MAEHLDLHSDTDDNIPQIGLCRNSKIIIMQTCLENPSNLFRKFSKDVTHEKLNAAWEKIASTVRLNGILITHQTLKKNVSNWITRAIGRNAKRKQTGVGKQAELSEIDVMCLSFVRQAKGDSAIDGISACPDEPSGSNAIRFPSAIPQQKKRLLGDEHSQKRGKVVTTIEEKNHRNKQQRLLDGKHLQQSSFVRNELSNEQPLRGKKKPKSIQNAHLEWKEGFYENMQNMEKERIELEVKISGLKAYNLLLRNMLLEKQLGLGAGEIALLRSSVDEHLNEYLIRDSAYGLVEEILTQESDYLEDNIDDHDLSEFDLLSTADSDACSNQMSH